MLNELKRRRLENKSFNGVPAFDEVMSVYNRITQRVSQKTSLASNMLKDLEKFIRKLDSDLAYFENELRGFGEFEQFARGLPVGSEVAVQITRSEVILGRVIFYHSDIGMYDVADIDDSKRYHLPDKNVVLLDLQYSTVKLGKGEEVLAVYPDTTSFYPATVAQAAKRNFNSSEPTVTLNFLGDADDAGKTSSFIPALVCT